ncbi:MAG: hypothetical protein NTX50_12245 [Candidatus Sumerlaeota bacterium]|nr:hypothetical protein [Candidatus Sumerlaeota bacterium]
MHKKKFLIPNPYMCVVEVSSATPSAILKYALTDKQALLGIIRYNHLLDTFLGMPCYSLQNNPRFSLPTIGVVETDEIYIGVGKKGNHYVIPVQAKGYLGHLDFAHTERDIAICAHKYGSLICCPVGAQLIKEGIIALFEFATNDGHVGLSCEKHYKLIQPDLVTDVDLESYPRKPSG